MNATIEADAPKIAGKAAPAGLEPLFSIKEVAAYLQVSTSTVYRLIRDGALRGVRVGQSQRFTRGNIQDFLEGCAFDANA
ncbi:MAG: helix-turn-helix domain-containing protein [Atopobiaceae bacterium]|jgi:excisionase family DNA binding protein